MSEWTTKKIEDLIQGQWPGEWGSDPTPAHPVVQVYRSTELDDDGHVRQGGVSRSVPASKVYSKRLDDGDILLEASGGTPTRPVGRVGLYNPEHEEVALCSNFLRTIRPKSDVSGAFLRWSLVLLHLQPEIWRYQQQTTGMSNLKVRDYLRHRIDVPPLAQQRRIAEMLSTIDEAIEQTEALIAKTQQIKAGLMHDLFTRGVTEDGELRPPREEAPQLYKDSPLGWIPKEWEVQPCRMIADGITVGIVVRPTQYYVTEGVPALRSANIRESGIAMTDLVYISETSNQLLAKSQVRAGDIVTVRTGYPGTSAVVPIELHGANCIDILITRPAECVVSAYLSAWINSSFGKDQVLRMQGGLAQQHFNVGELRELKVALPNKNEQAHIVEVLSSHQLRVTEEMRLLGKLSKLKRGLMQDLLTGRVRVRTDPSTDAEEADV